jgi:hypothetical protein
MSWPDDVETAVDAIDAWTRGDLPVSAVVRFRDGKVLRARDWLDHEHGLEAAEEQVAAP